MRMSWQQFRKMFPHLAEELENRSQEGPDQVRVKSVRSDVGVGEVTASKGFSGYSPDAIGFLRRCDTEEEALEIINYLEKRLEIDPRYAEKLRTQLKTSGVRSFGSKKQDNYYLKESGYD